MLFRQLFDKSSSTYTYLIASKEGREALIIDPVLENIDTYIETLNKLGNHPNIVRLINHGAGVVL